MMAGLIQKIQRRLRALTGGGSSLPVSRGAGVRIPGDARISSDTVIGDHSRFNRCLNIKGTGNVRFGNFCAVGEDLTVITSNHNTDLMNLQLYLFRKAGMEPHDIPASVSVGHNVWIGDRVTLLPGANIGSGAVIGAGSIVNKTVPPFTIAAGSPVRVIRQRCARDVADLLLETAWWHWPMERILANKELLDINIADADVGELRQRLKRVRSKQA